MREAGADHIRELIYRSHRILYAIEADRIVILAVIHGRRDIEQLRPWDDDG